MNNIRTFCAALLVLGVTLSFGQTSVQGLTCEHLSNPLGIDVKQPVLSWKITSEERNVMQRSYEIIVSDRLSDIQSGKGATWSSTVASSENTNIRYEGNPLKSFTQYYWRVKITDANNQTTDWSDIAWFETAMLEQGDWSAVWIGDGRLQPEKDEDYYKPDRMPLLRKEFTSSKQIRTARLYISGVGYYEAYLNGKKVSDNVLDPGWTTYKKQVLYVVHDVTSLISRGKNVAGVMLGNGWWNPLPFKLFGRWDLRTYQQTGRPCVKAELHITFTDGTKEKIITDESWQTAPGPIYKNNVYLGEHYDARMEQPNWNASGKSSTQWQNARVASGPDGRLTAQLQPAIKVTGTIKPVKIIPAGRDTFIVDMGQNFAGVLQIKVKGEAGQKITMRLGEGMFLNGKINLMTAVATQIKKGGIKGGPGAPLTAWQEDSYTLKGEGTEVWAPRFTFHGFRYVEVTGWPRSAPTINDFVGLRMNSALEQSGSFQCSNEMFNKLHDVIQWTFLSNVFSVQSDCPAREKMGYGADMVVSANAFIYNYDMRNFYRKAVQDFANEQRPEGGITEIAPFTGIADRGYGDDSGPMGWQLGFPFLQKQLYDFYGDKQIIEHSYPAFQKQLKFLKSKEIDGLFHWDISDHEALDPRPEAFSASVFYLHHVLLASEFAGILGKKEDSVQYEKHASRITRDIVSKYYVKNTGRFDNATQSAQVMALYYHLKDEEIAKVFQVLLSEFERHNMHISSGIFGTKMMFDVLRENDKNEIAYGIANQKDFPGWGHMLANDATTLWETWAFPETGPSRNHPMFGSIDEWFYRSLLGINPLEPGFSRIQIKPQPAGDLKWAKGHFDSVKGRIVSDWKIDTGNFTLSVEVPHNTTAEVWIPVSTKGVLLDGKDVISAPDLKFLKREGRYSVYLCGGGKYVFRSQMP
jgi:alpha-L-rhamnosidase